MMFLFLAISFFVGFVIESIVGFGGTLIAYSFLLFFFEIKALIISTIILPIIASIVILISDVKNISFKVLFVFTPICLIGIPVGIFLFDYLSSGAILKILATFLILFGIRNAFFGEIVIKGMFGKLIVFLSGILHGIVGTGGPVAIIGMKSSFRKKEEIRASLAVFFLVLNIFRITQLSLTSEVSLNVFFENIAISIPMILGIFIGHKIHKKISEKQFKMALSIFFIIAGVLLMFR